MINITEKNIQEFKNNGWCVVKSNLDKNDLEKYKYLVSSIIEKTKKKKYNLGRVYFDYLFDFNLAAVEAPLNKTVCSDEVIEFFIKINIGKAINKIKNWRQPICSLIRLFSMGNYNYSGHWHKDNVSIGNSIQASILLKSEKGFKIIKKKIIDDPLSEYNVNKIANSTRLKLPIVLGEEFYDTLSGDAGDIIFFEPYLLHKGSYNKSRIQFHMRFNNLELENSNDNFFQVKNLDFKFTTIYDFNKDEKEIKKDLPNIRRDKFHFKLKNTINYYFPLVNLFHYIKQKSSNNEYKYELFSNTAYQKKED